MNFADIEGFEWDSGNIHKNRLKHDVTASECEEVFFNAPLVFFDDVLHSSDKEKRYKILGVTSEGRGLALAVTVRNHKIRIIMARDQSPKERKAYEAHED